MRGLERRLRALEAQRNSPRDEDAEAALEREVLRRLTLEEKRSYVEALRRAGELSEGQEVIFAEEDAPILQRVATLSQEVRDELMEPSQNTPPSFQIRNPLE